MLNILNSVYLNLKKFENCNSITQYCCIQCIFDQTNAAFVHFSLFMCVFIHCLSPKKKAHTLIFRWTAFSFDYDTHSPWHHFDKLLQYHNIYSCLELHTVFAKILYWWWERQTTCKVFSSTSQRFSMGLRSDSGHCGGQSMCENYVSCSLNHSFPIWAWWTLALSSWNMPVPSGKNKLIDW